MDERPDCKFCNLSEKQVVKKLKYWTIAISNDQVFLGRSLIIHNGHIEDPMDTSEDERKELWEAMDKLHDALGDMFEPDMINWTILGNVIRHVHMHVIPRYATPRKWAGLTFDDHLWGGPPWGNEKRELKPAELEKLRKEIAAALK